jgi:hypothetical protein
MKTKKFEATIDALVIRDLNSLESILCDEGELAEALRGLNPDAPQEVYDAIEQLAFAWENDECVIDLMKYLGVEIRQVEEGAFVYECVGHYNDETYNSVRNRIANLWGFDPDDIDNIDWNESHDVFVGDTIVTSPVAVDYEVAINGRLVSFATDFTRNYLTD